MKKHKTQFYKLPAPVRADRRIQAYKMLDTGKDKYETASFFDVHYKTIERWIRLRAQFEKNNGHDQKRGNPTEQHLLTLKQQEKIVKAITTSTPEKEGVHTFLWSRRAIIEYVQTKFSIKITDRTVSKYTKRWGLSVQRPAKQAVEQDAEKVRIWVEETYPALQVRAKKEGAVIQWGDETNININTNYQKTYAFKGKTPTMKIPARKTSCSMVSTVSNQGMTRYMVYKGGMNAKLFRVFLNRLIKDVDQKVFLILDNLRVHHAKIIQAWQQKHQDKIEIFFPATILSSRKS